MEISILVVTFILACTLHFGVQRLFIYYKRFDEFNNRSSHKTSATLTGGIGIFFTLLIISFYNYFQGIELFDYSLFIPLGIMFIIGVYDDLYNADFKLKFLLQIIVAKILIDQGFVISNYNGLFGIYEVSRILAQLSTVFVFLVIVNSINFIDGIDGLALTEVIKTIVLVEFFSSKATPLAPMSILLIASMLSLYYFNFKKKQKIFLGDGGSLLLATVMAIYAFYVLGIDFNFNPAFRINKTLFSVLILLYPLMDLLRVFVIRVRDKKSPFEADNRHIHHFLQKKLNNHLKVTLVILILEILLTFFCVFIYKISI